MNKTGFSTMLYERQRSTCAIFAGIAAIVIACIYFVARWGFADNSLLVVLKTVSLGLFLIFLPAAYHITCAIVRLRPTESWFNSDATICLVGIFIVSALGFLSRDLRINFMTLIALIGCGSALVIFAVWLSQNRIRCNVIFIAGAALFSVWVAGAIYGSGYSNPLYEEALVAGRYLAKDILVSTGITNMISTYGVPSTGLDGLPYCYHHWGAYWLFAGMAALIGIDALKFMQLGFPVIFLPLFLWMFLQLVILVREQFGHSGETRDLTLDYAFWAVFSAAIIGGMIAAVSGIRIGENAQFVSITYSVGLTFTFAVLSLCVMLFPKRAETKELSLADHCLICLLPFLLVIVGFLKISLMYLLVAIYGYLFLRLKLWRYGTIVASLLVTLIALFVVMKFTTNQGSGFGGIDPLRFFRSTGKFSWTVIFFPVYYFWLFLFVVWQLYDRQALGFRPLKQAILDNRTIEAEVVVVTCLAGILPHALMVIPGGSGFYFIDLQQWLAVCLLLANLEGFRSRAPSLNQIPDKIRADGSLTRATYVLASIVVVCVLGVIGANACTAVWRMVALNLNIRCALVTSCSDEQHTISPLELACSKVMKSAAMFPDLRIVADNIHQLLSLVYVAQESLEKSKGFPTVSHLKLLGELPLSEKEATLMYIPQSNKSYWELIPKCEAEPFIAPSIAGMALVDGMPRADCPLQTDPLINHYAIYKWRSAEQHSLDLDDATICAKVRANGFSKVIVVNADANRSVLPRPSNCR